MKFIGWNKVKLEKEIEVLNKFINPRYGICRRIESITRFFEDANMYLNLSITSRPWNTGIFPGMHLITEGNSANEDQTLSMVGAVGESLERYCSIFYDKKVMEFGSYNELHRKDGIEYIHPETFAFFSKKQKLKIHELFTANSKIYWTPGFSLIDRRIKMVPAQSVYLPYFPGLDENVIDRSISTGMAFGITLEDTIYTGLMETVERDSFTIYWLNKLELPRIKYPFGFTELDRWYEKMFGDLYNEVNIFDVTTDLGIPTFFSLIKGRNQFLEPFISVGSAANINPVTAIKKAIIESFHTRKYGFSIMYTMYKKDLPINTDAIKSNPFYEHVQDYIRPFDTDEISFCYTPHEEIDFNLIYEKYKFNKNDSFVLLKEAINRIQKLNYEPIVVDMTTEDVREKLFYAIKTIVPGLHPLWAGEDIPLGGKRIYEVPEKMGFKRKQIHEMNVFPHPFP
jgi:ribosomal protein S12 methylthiotransferase accessory factor